MICQHKLSLKFQSWKLKKKIQDPNVGFSNKVLVDVDNLMDSFVAVLLKSPIRLRSHLLPRSSRLPYQM